MGFYRNWRRKRILQHHSIDAARWQRIVDALPLLHGLTDDELKQLHSLASLLIHEKQLEPVQELAVDDDMRVWLAVQMALPIMNLGIDWYDGWTSIVLYPGEFASRVEWVDEFGIAHSRREVRSGEAWHRGPVVLSWADVAASGYLDGFNTAIHEMAHKLDGYGGSVDGCPALHAGMSRQAWHTAFSTAYEDFCRRVDGGEHTELDPYGASAPEEFFAVMSEHFFETPDLLNRIYPAVYEQMAQFYRQSPLKRLASRIQA